MAQKQGQESQSCYMDGTHVKISERYKPPPRINPVITYAQRLSLNKQLLDNMLDYDFSREEGLLAKIDELKCARKALADSRKSRSEKIRCQRKKLEEEHELKAKDEEQAVSENMSEACVNKTAAATTAILIPSRAAAGSYSGILTPIPLASQPYNCQATDKSPFNISDFEADTSSPFDNMELKTLNDMEELAQVLKSETKPSDYYNPLQSNPSSYSAYLGQYVPPSLPTFIPPPNLPVYSNTNGYYYVDNQPNVSYVASPKHEPPPPDAKISSFRSVPDIMKALEEELATTRLDNNAQNYNHNHLQPSRPKSTDAVYPKAKAKNTDLEDPFSLLSKELQELSRDISSMGFPLPRVARACEHLGADHKKVVEHLLALSELMDLGFPEKEVSKALLQCGNDRDKALDKLLVL